jgi:SAM-dependent methyltransferase
MHGTEPVSPWIARFSKLVPPGSRVLDVACGAGRHIFYLLEQKHTTAGVDINKFAIESIANQLSEEERQRCELLCADLEDPLQPWPLAGRLFDAIVVTNYLWRPRLPDLLSCLAPGGVLLYETFASGQETVGKPSRPDFLLRRGELLEISAAAGLRVVAFEDGYLAQPERFVQRVAAVREAIALLPEALSATSPKYPLL